MTAIAAMIAVPLRASAVDAPQKPTVHMVSNAHFDTQWRWTVQRSIGEYIPRTLTQNLALFGEYPGYIFNFEGAVKYAWMKEYYPDLFDKVKGYVALGRWHVSGASWDATDANMPSVESGIRNILLGQEFYMKEFGIVSTDIMLPDCFGFGWQLPSIAAHCGLVGFGTQKLSWRNKPFYEGGRRVPFNFGIWKGIDGSRVMAALNGGGYAWSPEEPVTDEPDLKNFLEQSALPAAYHYFGTGDSGGSAHPRGIRFIDDAVRNPGSAYDLKFATTDEMFFKYLWDGRLPEFDGELLMDIHATGCYSSKAEMKNLNRRNEWALGAAEGISTFADRLGGIKYPAYTIDNGWKRIIWHQFHDDLTGTSLPECYQFSYNDEYLNLRQAGSIIESAALSSAAALDTRAKGLPVVVYNPVSAPNADPVEIEIPLKDRYRSVIVRDPSGRRVPAQIIGRAGGRARILFAGSVPSMGLAVYDIVPSVAAEVSNPSLKTSAGRIENSIYAVTLDSDGDIVSILDKRCSKELVRKGEAFSLAFFDGNVSDHWPAWEIFKETMDKTPSRVNGGVKVSVEECGPLRAVLKVERTHAGSTFIQRIILTEGATDERIDIVNTVDWNSKSALLKASFPVAFDAPQAVYDLGMGHVARGTNTDIQYEVYAHQWADMTSPDGSYGVTIMNDAKYGWDKPDDHTLRLTLFHTPSASRGFGEQATQDFGVHEFTYSIVGHSGALDPAQADIVSDCLNAEKYAFATESHTGALGKSVCLARSTNPALRIKALKRAQDGDGIIVRVYELSGKGASGSIVFDSDILSVEEVNGIEAPLGAAPRLQAAPEGSFQPDGRVLASAAAAVSFEGRSFKVESGRFALRTFRVRLAGPATRVKAASYKTLDLPFNTVGITTDDYPSEGCLAYDLRESFAAEILPERLEHRGIPFVFGEPNYHDAVICKGQTLALPEGVSKVYFLAASQRPDGAETALDFKVGERLESRKVSSYTGFYGVYGWPGYYESSLRTDDVAYVGSHTHNPEQRNKPYVFSYLYLVEVDANGADSIVLPDNKDAVIFSATALLK
ncbi:MAG: glycosyl hydrolase-related protein [Bacteroidales bacterium]|nr:glycosyl hydrolase-related protein [Bacteroidales bacterium]